MRVGCTNSIPLEIARFSARSGLRALRGVPDYSIESAICKVAGTESISHEAHRALQLKGCEGSTAVD
jgi:hypothetical protein